MPIQIGDIITRNPYRTSAVFSNYGETVFHNGATQTSTNSWRFSTTFEWLKMIQESLESIGVGSKIVTYTNSTNNDSYYMMQTLKFILNTVEFQIDFKFWNSTGNFQFGLSNRGDATSNIDFKISPRVPVAGINTPYWNDVIEDMTNAEFAGYAGDVNNWQGCPLNSSVECKVQAVVYDEVIYILTKATSSGYAPLFIVGGKLGTGVGDNNMKSFGLSANPYISRGGSSYRSQCATANDSSHDFWTGSVICALRDGYSGNTSTSIMGYPVYFTTEQRDTSDLFTTCGVLAVKTKYLLGIAGRPLPGSGSRYASSTWICPSPYNNESFGSIIMPWDGESASVFD